MIWGLATCPLASTAFLPFYNHERTHRGYRLRRRSPATVFRAWWLREPVGGCVNAIPKLDRLEEIEQRAPSLHECPQECSRRRIFGLLKLLLERMTELPGAAVEPIHVGIRSGNNIPTRT